MASILFRNRIVFWGVILVLFFVLIFLTKIAFTPSDLKNNVTPSPAIQTTGLCASFSTDKGEISCEEAKGIALKKYPGKLLSVEKTIRYYESGTPPKTQTKEVKVWIIDIRPDNQSLFPPLPKDTNIKFKTTDAIEVAVDRNTKEILFFQPFFKK